LNVRGKEPKEDNGKWRREETFLRGRPVVVGEDDSDLARCWHGLESSVKGIDDGEQMDVECSMPVRVEPKIAPTFVWLWPPS
jgi:hypothetical protein